MKNCPYNTPIRGLLQLITFLHSPSFISNYQRLLYFSFLIDIIFSLSVTSNYSIFSPSIIPSFYEICSLFSLFPIQCCVTVPINCIQMHKCILYLMIKPTSGVSENNVLCLIVYRQCVATLWVA
jgi:hypothetical protein